MTPNDVSHIENEFGLRLPEWYVGLLNGLEDDESRVEIESKPDDLCKTNATIRTHGAWGFRWDPTFWAIGGDGAGGIYFIDTASTHELVYYIDHECPPRDIDDDQLYSQTPAEIIEEIADYERDHEMRAARLRERIANRKWWQFWIPRRAPKWAEE